MSFSCHVYWNSHLFDTVGASTGVRERARNGEKFHTERDYEFLSALCTQARKLNLPTPLHWRGEPRVWSGKGKKRPHVRKLPRQGKQRCAPIGSQEAHRWLQDELVDLAKEIGEVAELELWLDGGRRADVVWKKHQLCWEVDRSPQGSSEQAARHSLRAEAGLTTISLVQWGHGSNEAHAHLPRILVNRMNSESEKAEQAAFGLGELYVNNLLEFADGHWHNRSEITFRHFLYLYLSGSWEYSKHGWASAEDIQSARLHFAQQKKAAEERRAAALLKEAHERKQAELLRYGQLKGSRDQWSAMHLALTNLNLGSAASRDAYEKARRASTHAKEHELLEGIRRLRGWRIFLDLSGNKVSLAKAQRQDLMELSAREIYALDRQLVSVAAE